ncbi:hypothetical protein Tco_0857650 [Tanacetum coccineum]|uniref:Uncharacterized protein n=1 Tax=Tanacetum coccineum TaxID=301880 RepID=A0ABQ5BAT8_9ASTR
MEEYIRLEEEKARKHEKVFNWETAKYGKIWYDEDVYDLRSVETEFLSIVFNDNLTSNETLSCEPTVSSLNNNEIDFRISFDKSDDEDYMVIFDRNSFSYKITYANDLKTNSEYNEKVNMHLFPSPEPTVSCLNDLDFFKDFENEFPAIVYNDALTSKSDFSTEPTLCPQHIDEFDLKDETSLSEYDEEEQNILYFNDLFLSTFLGKDWTLDMRQDLAKRDEDGIYWGRWSGALRLHTAKEMAEDGFGAYWLGSERVIPDKGDLSDYWVEISSGRDFLRGGGMHLKRYTEGKKSGAMLSVGHFIGCLAHHFGLVSDDGLRGLYVVTRGTKRQPVAAAAAPGDVEDAPDIDDGAQAIPAPIHAPPPPPPVAGRTIPQRLGRLEEEIQGLRQDVRSLRGLMERSMTDQGRFSIWMVSCMTQLMEASGHTYQAFDGTFRGSYPAVFERRTRCRTDGASTSTA